MKPNTLHLAAYPGWFGLHTRAEAAGAWPNGTRVRKVLVEPGDAHPIGAVATIIGSVDNPIAGGFGYFVEWEAMPKHAVFVLPSKIRPESAT